MPPAAVPHSSRVPAAPLVCRTADAHLIIAAPQSFDRPRSMHAYLLFFLLFFLLPLVFACFFPFQLSKQGIDSGFDVC